MAEKIPLRLFNRLNLPITLVIAYLTTTLILFEFGPIDYFTPNKPLFYAYLFYYLFALFIGYLTAIRYFRVRTEERAGRMIFFWHLVLFAVIGSLIENSNAARLGSLLPTNIISLFASGFDLNAAGSSYLLIRENAESYSSNRILNIVSFLIAWARIFLVIYIGSNIHRLSRLKIIAGLTASMIYPLGALSIGLNKPVMETAIFFIVSVAALMFIKRSEISPRLYRGVKVWSRIGFVLILFGVWNFVNNMQARGVTVFFLEITSPAQYITVNCGLCSREETGFLTGIIWLVNYVVQGYHGFSLALEQPFDSTFGFGNSAFLMRQFEVFTGINLAPFTFQEKTDHLWGATSHWHSIYTHFANDVHFLGVGGVMFVLGWLFAATWKLAILQKNVYAFILIPIYAYMFVFFPASNQIFGFIASLSAYIFGNLMMFRTYIKGRRAR